MGLHSEFLGLPATGLPLLRDLVHERTGLFYDNSRCDTLGERLAPLVVERGFRSFLDLYYLLRYDAAAPAEWSRVVNALSVQETYFWREVDQLEALAQTIVPALIQARAPAPLRIWSVPCATGEEPLSIAMALDQAGWFDRASIEIHGSDASTAAIDKARAGHYRERAFRSLPPALRERYFEPDQGGARVRPDLRARITSWSVVNLMSRQEIAPYAGSPVIFCRNAFIYFSRQSVGAVVDALADAMPSPSYLLVGASESLLQVTERFTLEDTGNAFVYVKR